MGQDIRAARSNTTMRTGHLALRLLAVSLCIWMTNAATSTTATTSSGTSTTVAATTTTSAAATTTTTAATTAATTSAATTVASTGTVHRKKIRISNLKWASKRRIKVHRGTTNRSTRSRSVLGRRILRSRNGSRARVLVLNQRRAQG